MFRFRTQRECCGCRSTYSHASCCLLLRVSGEQKRLEEILQSYWNEEAVNARCEICKSDGPLFFLPEVGIFYLPPVDTKVVFPFEFNPDPFTSRQDDVVYSLYAVVVYRPKEKERVEHYYCYISVSPGQWFLFDDTEVKPVDTYVVRSARPCMLFYRKTTHSDSEEELSQKKDTQLNSELPDDIDYLAYIDYLYNGERTSENDWLFYIGIIMLLVVGFILAESLQFDESGERRERKK